MGLVDFTEIRPNCTEVTLAVHYEIKNKLFAWLDRRFHFVEAFVNSELRSLRAHFEGIAAPVAERPAYVAGLRDGDSLTTGVRRIHERGAFRSALFSLLRSAIRFSPRASCPAEEPARAAESASSLDR